MRSLSSLRVLISEYKVSKLIAKCLFNVCLLLGHSCSGVRSLNSLVVYVSRYESEVFQSLCSECEDSKLFEDMCSKFESMVFGVLYSGVLDF